LLTLDKIYIYQWFLVINGSFGAENDNKIRGRTEKSKRLSITDGRTKLQKIDTLPSLSEVCIGRTI